ncbi:MAG: class I SAM-dependent methyltransferase [Chthoniobacterales bacterium]
MSSRQKTGTFLRKSRRTAAEYYDRFCNPPPGDVGFYRSRVTSRTRVLELGCGTGRVLLPLAERARYVHGLDESSDMLEICRRKLAAIGFDPSKATVQIADITAFDVTRLGPPFDLIIAPFRVMQNLETDEQIDGLMQCISTHLAPGGVAILNTFCPRGPVQQLKAFWDSRDGSQPSSIRRDGTDTVEIADICTRYREQPLIVYPELIYQRFNASGQQTDEAILKISMRVWYPEQFLTLIQSYGFEIIDRFGGYQGEPWSTGPELVVAFTRDRTTSNLGEPDDPRDPS